MKIPRLNGSHGIAKLFHKMFKGLTSGDCEAVNLKAVSFHLPVSEGCVLLIWMPHWVDVCWNEIRL